MKTKCQECGGSDLQWHSTVINTSSVQDGRLRAHDMAVSFFLGCNTCSATVQRATGDQIAVELTELAERSAEYSRWMRFHDAGDGDFYDFMRREGEAEAAKLAAQAAAKGAAS